VVDEEKRRACNMCMPELVRQRHEALIARMTPTGVVLPWCFDPGEYDDDDLTDALPTIMGLPVIFEGAEIKVLVE